MSFGKFIDASVLEQGLRELCPDLIFDVTTKRGAWHPRQATRQGVFYNLHHICSMDRGLVPELPQCEVVTKMVEVGWEEADKDEVSIQARVIPSNSREFVDAALHIMAKDVGWEFRPDGSIVHMTPVALRKMQGRIEMVGWRHTFESLISRGVPGITRQSLAAKFGVDMLKYPLGAPFQVIEAMARA